MVRIRIIALAFGLVALAGACAQDEPAITEPDETPAATEATSGGETLTIADSDLGEILADADGRTLYAFLNDKDGKSTCTDTCAQNWPALTVDGEPTAGEGVDEELLGTTERDDDTTQVTYNDMPLYHYAADEEAGDTNGQGVGKVWYVVGADGETIKDSS